jgi:hypothetical protein
MKLSFGGLTVVNGAELFEEFFLEYSPIIDGCVYIP